MIVGLLLLKSIFVRFFIYTIVIFPPVYRETALFHTSITIGTRNGQNVRPEILVCVLDPLITPRFRSLSLDGLMAGGVFFFHRFLFSMFGKHAFLNSEMTF